MITEILISIVFLVIMIIIIYRWVKMIWLYIYFVKTMNQFGGNKLINKMVKKKEKVKKKQKMSEEDGVAYQ